VIYRKYTAYPDPCQALQALRSGRGGLDSVIQWTHIVDFPDVAPWVLKGDLLITTGFDFKDDPDGYLKLIPVLALIAVPDR
jgi:purine catabolism regulator